MEHIRPAEPRDISRIAEILVFTKRMNYRSIFHNDQVSFGVLQVLPVAEEYLENEAKLAGHYVYDDGFVKGLIHVTGREISEFYVDHFFQGEGIGGKLFDFAAEQCGANFLWVLEKNTGAIRFYTRHGFLPTGDRIIEEGTPEYCIKMERKALK